MRQMERNREFPKTCVLVRENTAIIEGNNKKRKGEVRDVDKARMNEGKWIKRSHSPYLGFDAFFPKE